MNGKARKIKYGPVDLTRNHFLISYSHECGGSEWIPVAVLSAVEDVDQVRLCLLVHEVSYLDAIGQIQNELEYYFYLLKNPSPVGYLILHCCSLSNVYGRIHYGFVDQISKDTLFYYMFTKAKVDCIWNNSKVSQLIERYIDLTIRKVFDMALDIDNQYVATDFNADLLHLYSVVYDQMPQREGFSIQDKHTIVEFSKLLSEVNVNEFCNIINYFIKIKIIKTKEISRLLEFYYENFQLQGIETNSTIGLMSDGKF